MHIKNLRDQVFNRLTVRLLVSFITVLLVTIGISLVALVLVLRSRPVNTDTLKLHLASLGLEIRQNFLETLLQPRNLRTGLEAQAITYFEEQAEANDVRLMILDTDAREWIFDSHQDYPRPFTENLEREALIGETRFPEGQLYSGTFSDERGEWVYVEQGFGLNVERINPKQRTNYRFYVATPLPKQTVASVVEESNNSGLFLALIQAGMAGFGVALIFAFGLVRWISKPLRELVLAAVKVAQGDYKTRATVRGPFEVRTVALAFNQMTSRVELSQQAQRDFLANVSHDLRTPLTSIQGFAQAISEGVADEADTKHAAEIIQNEAGRLARMVNELLDLARIQAGRLDMLRQAVELTRVLQTVGDALQVKAREKNVLLHVKISALPRIAGDGDRLAQVFMNLVDNAIKHTEIGGEVWLEAQLDDSSGGILIQVRDTGEGIPSQDIPRIFERFYQVDKSRTKRAGTGLGLAITYEIIQAHHGRVWVESRVGLGSVFSVWLPQPLYDKQETVLYQRQKHA